MERIGALDGLRAISILAVLSAHILPLGPKSLQLNAAAGAMGMSLFFALSGFLITSNLIAGQGVFEFSVRRLTRILPLAYLYLLIVYLVFSYNPHALLSGLLFIENYDVSGVGDWDQHFWSLCVEMQFYLAIGLTVAFFGAERLWLIILACFAVLAMRVTAGALIHIQTHLRVDEILAGGVLALLYHRGMLRICLSAWWLVPILAFWFACSSPFGGALQYLRPYSSAMVMAAVIMLGSGRVLQILTSKAAVYIAAISFALYVVHPATIHGWMNEGSSSVRYLFKRPISLAATFLLAHFSTFHWERPWIEWGKRVTFRRQQRQAATL